LAKVDRMASGIGWGFGDYVGDIIAGLEGDLGEQS
jgi:hypothetical protein